MFSGLKLSKSHKNSALSSSGKSVARKDSADLDKLLQEEIKTRKKRLSGYCWYQEKITTRAAAESKLKQSHANKKSQAAVYLIRRSTACDNEFVLSFCYNDACYHYNIVVTINYKYRLLNSDRDFNGLDELLSFYEKNDVPGDLPCRLTKACNDGQPPPPLSLSRGYTNALHRAIVEGDAEKTMRILSNSNCPPIDDRNDQGSTALHLACNVGSEAVVEALLQNEATIWARDIEGYSALQLACRNNHCAIARMLIVKGDACPHWRVPSTGNVALHIAAEQGHLETVRMLLSLDIPSHSRNFEGRTPYDLAVANGHQNCAEFIDNYHPPDAQTKRDDWFHEKITREQAKELLEKSGVTDGLFLVRHSSRDPSKYVLDLCHQQQVKHYTITEFMSIYCIDAGPLLPSLEHLVEYYCVFSDGLPTTLKDAISPAGHLVSLAAIAEGVHLHYPPDLPGRDRFFVSSSFKFSSPWPVKASTKLLCFLKNFSKLWMCVCKMFQPPVATEPMVLHPDTIEKTYELGQGEYGSVFKGTWKAPSGELVAVAVKTLNKQHLVSGKEGFMREAKVMVQLDHPCIVKLIGICEGTELMLVQELMPLGSLLDFLLDYPEQVNVNIDLLLWSQQIAYGMKYLEKQSLVHRDLAARNILLQSKSQVKICDFGLSRATGANSDYYRASAGGKWPVKWYAPESINYGTFSSASDVWGYGVTLWEMYSFGDQPYSDMTGAQVLQYIERKGRLTKPQDCPDNVYMLMRRCWEYKASDRPSFKQIYLLLQSVTTYENVSTVKLQTQI